MDVKDRQNAYFPQLTGLKVVALLGIFCWHSMPHSGLPDFGARLVELFFVTSGFLVGFRRHGAFDMTISGCWNYVWPKVRSLYPVYLLGLALGLFQVCWRGAWSVGVDAILPAIWALGLQQAWIPSISMMYNGASWFISAWVFCMLCAPVLQWTLLKMRNSLGTVRGLAVFLVIMLSARVFLETCQMLAPGAYPYSLHVTPAVRLLEFALAYGTGVMFCEYRCTKGCSPVFGTVLEVLAIALVFACIYLGRGWPRWAYVLMWVMVILILSGGGGLVSRLLSWKPIVACEKIEMEFFLLHNAIIGIISAWFVSFGLGGYKKTALISLLATIILSIVCHRLFHGAGRGHRLDVNVGTPPQGRA